MFNFWIQYYYYESRIMSSVQNESYVIAINLKINKKKFVYSPFKKAVHSTITITITKR